MKWSREQLLDRFLARDETWNGRFVVGVKTTGIYCLPSCPARRPKAENTLLFEDEAGALAAGLRACKRCRPDHFYRHHEPDLEAVEALADEVRRDPAAFPDVPAMARASGLGKTKLSALFREHFHETPAAFLAAERVRAVARRLATEAGKPLELAFELGFESASAFHDNFSRELAVRPGEYRKLAQGAPFRLSLPADFDRERTFRLLGRDGESPTERVDGRRFAKALHLDGRDALLVVKVTGRSARCELCGPAAVSPAGRMQAHEVARRMLGLACDPADLARIVRRTRGLSRLTRGREGLRVLLTADAFEALVWSILGQQVNLAFAMTLRRRLVELVVAARPAGRRSPAELEGLVPHPTPAELAALDLADLAPLQFSRRKAEYLVDLARAVVSGELDLDHLARGTATRAERALLACRGIGPWSANYVLMRGIGFGDSLPVGDSGLTSALARFFELERRPGPDETRELMKPFRPCRSLACLHFWQLLDGSP